jgi:hypothetical protein
VNASDPNDGGLTHAGAATAVRRDGGVSPPNLTPPQRVSLTPQVVSLTPQAMFSVPEVVRPRFVTSMGGPDTSAGVAFGMAVGPGEASMAIDTLDSIAAFFPQASRWILDDCTSDGTYPALRQWVATHGGRLFRNARPRGYRGIAGSFYSLLSAIAREEPTVQMAIKIDPDTCLLGGDLLDRIRSRFAAHGPGVVGAYRIGAGGRAREFSRIRRNMLVDLWLPVGPHKTWRAVRMGRPYWARYLSPAIRHGYVFGEHVLGALAAIHGETLHALVKSGFLDVPANFRALTVQMDVLLGLGVRAVGHQLMDLDDAPPNPPSVWLQFLPPVPVDANTLVERGMLAVHPVKATPEGDAMREVFRERRRCGADTGQQSQESATAAQ